MKFWLGVCEACVVPAGIGSSGGEGTCGDILSRTHTDASSTF